MSTFATFIFVLFLSEFCYLTFGTDLRLKDEFDALVSVGRTLEQTASERSIAQEGARVEFDCGEVIVGADLLFEQGEVLRTFTAANITACCEGCQSMENCTTFHRNRASGSCELFSLEEVYFLINSNSDFDIGGFVGKETRAKSHPVPSTSPVPDCRINRGVSYPNGEVLKRRSYPTARHCCEACRASGDCNSWYYNNRNRRCTLNHDIPAAVATNSSRFRGGNSRD